MDFDAPEEHALLRDSVRQFFSRDLPETRIRTRQGPNPFRIVDNDAS